LAESEARERSANVLDVLDGTRASSRPALLGHPACPAGGSEVRTTIAIARAEKL